MTTPKHSPAAKHAQPAVAQNTGSSGSAPSLQKTAGAVVADRQGLTMPLPADVSRCMGLGEPWGESCPKINECARAITVRYDSQQLLLRAKVLNRACSDESYLMFWPLTGMPTLGDRT